MMKSRNHTSPNGMTILELLIVMTALAIVILISVPGSSYLLETYRLNQASNALVKSIESAFHQAKMRHSVVRVCPSSNGKFCRRDGDWDQGWLVYSDGNNDGVVHEIELLEAFEAPNENVRILASGAVMNSASFNISGLIEDHGFEDGEFQVCYLGSNTRVRSLSVSADGWVTMTQAESKGCDSI